MENIDNYLDYTQKPWGKMFYEIIFRQLGDISGNTVLDFGSGFGITADFLARHNEVTAIEPNELMIERRPLKNNYTQIIGGVEKLRLLPNEAFDVIICHNVLEYVADKYEIMAELVRVLKPDGFISIVKHNRIGKIMQKAVSEYKLDEVRTLLGLGNVRSANFGTIDIYEISDLLEYCGGSLKIQRCMGVRTFYGLQNNDIKYGDDWFENTLELELSVCDIDEFSAVSFFNHLILTKKENYSENHNDERI